MKVTKYILRKILNLTKKSNLTKISKLRKMLNFNYILHLPHLLPSFPVKRIVWINLTKLMFYLPTTSHLEFRKQTFLQNSCKHCESISKCLDSQLANVMIDLTSKLKGMANAVVKAESVRNCTTWYQFQPSTEFDIQ